MDNWRNHFRRVRVLWRLRHMATGEPIACRGYRLEAINPTGKDLADREGLPIVVVDSTIDSLEWAVVAWTDLRGG